MAAQDRIDPDDLDLVDDGIEDAGKDHAALWSEMDQAEAAGEDPAAEESSAADGREGSDDAPPDDDERQSGDEPDDAEETQDIWANATPEQRQAFEALQAERAKLEQDARSNRGRVSVLQRQINQLMAHKPAASPEAAEATGGDQEEGVLASDEWKRFVDEYPDVAGPLAKVIGNQQSEISRLQKELSAIGNERRQNALDEQAQLLADQHPDWQEVASNQDFATWLQDQPRHIQEAAYRNAEAIVDAAEAADIVGRFKQHLGQAQPNNAPGRPAQGNGNNRLAGKRQRQLESAATARSRGPGAVSGIPEDGDPEAIWKQWDELERRQQRA